MGQTQSQLMALTCIWVVPVQTIICDKYLETAGVMIDLIKDYHNYEMYALELPQYTGVDDNCLYLKAKYWYVGNNADMIILCK